MDDPFVKFSRDRQGYEHFFIVHVVQGRRGRVRQRVLYWFRTPPHVKMGREPFDDSVRRALEAQNPNLRFDWDKIRNTPIPPVQPEYWRERRLAERAARQAQESPEPESEVVPPEPVPEAGQDLPERTPVAAARGVADESRSARRRRRRRGGGGYGTPGSDRVAGSTGQTDGAPPSSIESDASPAASSNPETPGGPDVDEGL